MGKQVEDFAMVVCTSKCRPCVERVNYLLIPSGQLGISDPANQCSQLAVNIPNCWSITWQFSKLANWKHRDANYYYWCCREFLSDYYRIYSERFTTVSFELGKCWRKQLWKSSNLQMSSVSVGVELPDISMSNTLSEAAVMYAGTFVTREWMDRIETGTQGSRKKSFSGLKMLDVKT